MRPCWLSTFLVIGKVHGAVLSHNMVGVCIFEDKIVGPAVANNQFSRDHDASITMSNNKFGRFPCHCTVPAGSQLSRYRSSAWASALSQ